MTVTTTTRTGDKLMNNLMKISPEKISTKYNLTFDQFQLVERLYKSLQGSPRRPSGKSYFLIGFLSDMTDFSQSHIVQLIEELRANTVLSGLKIVYNQDDPYYDRVEFSNHWIYAQWHNG